jgi:hypothetical protein
LGYSQSIFPAPFERTLVQGYTAYSLMSPKVFFPILATLFGLLVLLNLFPFVKKLLGAIESSKAGTKLAEILGRVESNVTKWEEGPPPQTLVELTFKIIILFLTASSVVGLTIYMFSVSKDIGHSNAELNKRQMTVEMYGTQRRPLFPKTSIMYQGSSDKLLNEKQGYIIESSEKFYALFDGSEVVLIPTGQIQLIRIVK